MSNPRARLAGLAPWLVHGGVALCLLRLSLAPQRYPGGPLSEGWGRLFVTAQVARWVSGEAPWGVADLAGWPERVPFWPVDPLVQALSVPLSALLGDAAALTAVTLALVTLSGLGPYALARTLGAERGGAVAAGVVVQLSPFLLQNRAALVLEVEAVGLLALAAAAMIRAAKEDGARAALLAGLAIFALAATSPYYAVYLALGSALVALVRPRAWRASLRLGAVGAVACVLALAPLLLVEGGERGRLGPQYQGRGYHPTPGAIVHADGSRWVGPTAPPAAAAADRGPAAPEKGGDGRDPTWKRVLALIPGGAVALFSLGVGLLSPRSRPLALLGLAFFLVGPGPARLASLLGLGRLEGPGPLQELLRLLPLTNTMGNPTRALAPVLVTAAAAAGVALGRRRALAALLAGLALAEAWVALPGLRVPATTARPPQRALDALDGPVIVFPSGDPPFWHPAVAPKETLYLAGRAGVPVSSDYGRGRRPADLQAQVRLSAIADTPISERALAQARPLPPDETLWPALPFEHLLVLEDRLSEEQRERLRAWLEAHATLLAQDPGASAWSLPRP